ncbi:MAG: hypothetical protein A3K77_06320 [Euryarchaeota archaeon RBG_13_31_8]|nr:MAG: hypothetical protein A3K77_06320 [Euryarchaeota archaeon RBG_13_31_8]
MEWLKKLLGEENYNKLTPEILDLLKTKLGDKEYIENDPTRIIPKHVFNEKNEEAKLLKAQIEQYKSQLKETGNLITDVEVKTKLAEQELRFKSQITEMEKNYKKEIERENKKFLLTNHLNNNGAKHTELLMNVINLDEVIIQDGKLLNGDSVILPLKELYKPLFETSLKPTVLPQGNPKPVQTDKQTLINKYNEAERNFNFPEMERIKTEIKSLE